MISKILGIHYWLHSETGKKTLSIYWPRVKKYLPGAKYFEWAYWKLDDPKTGFVEEEQVDFGESPEVVLGEQLRYQDIDKALKDKGLYWESPKQTKDTCGWYTLNSMFAINTLMTRGNLTTDRPIATEHGYAKHRWKTGGTATNITYPAVINEGLPIEFFDVTSDYLPYTTRYFSKMSVNKGSVDEFFNWVDKQKNDYETKGVLRGISLSKRNMKAVPTYGVVIPKLLNKSREVTGGHITAVDWRYGVFDYKGERAVRVPESSHPKGEAGFKIYTESVLKVILYNFKVLEVEPTFYDKSPVKIFDDSNENVYKASLMAQIERLKEQLTKLNKK